MQFLFPALLAGGSGCREAFELFHRFRRCKNIHRLYNRRTTNKHVRAQTKQIQQNTNRNKHILQNEIRFTNHSTNFNEMKIDLHIESTQK